MGFYDDRIVPRIIDKACGMKALREHRRRVCAGLAGDVVEMGCGSGLNVPSSPSAVPRTAAVEPADLGWQLAGKRLAATTVPIERAGLDGQRLPFPDDTYDAALSTWTMCTIPDITAALAEVRRVLETGGGVGFLGHGGAPGPRGHKRRQPPHPPP